MEWFFPETLAPIWFLPLLVLLWGTISLLIAIVSGWRQLSESYGLERPFQGRRFRMQSASMRWGTSYNGVMVVGANTDGLYLSVFPLFRVGHPPVFVPWRHVSARETRHRLRRMVELRFTHTADIPVRILPGLAQKLAREAGGHWPGTEGLDEPP